MIMTDRAYITICVSAYAKRMQTNMLHAVSLENAKPTNQFVYLGRYTSEGLGIYTVVGVDTGRDRLRGGRDMGTHISNPYRVNA